MSESILEASKKSRTSGVLGVFKKKSVIAFVFVVILGLGAFYFFSKGNANDKTQITTKQTNYTVKKDDIKIAIESDGKVVAEDGVELSFSLSGDNLELVETFVKEGDYVNKGDKIARVDADSLELSLQSAYASYQSALASYNDKLDGASSEDITKSENNIKQAEINLAQAELSLARTKANVEEQIESAEDKVSDAKEDLDYDYEDDFEDKIDEEYSDLVSSAKSIVISLEDILEDSDEILGVDNSYLNDDFEDYLGKKDSGTLRSAMASYTSVKASYDDIEIDILALSDFSSQTIVDDVAAELLTLLDLLEDHLFDVQELLASSITSSDFSQNDLNALKSTINSNRNNINTKVSSLNNDITATEDALDALADYQEDYDETKIDLEEAYEDALENLEEVKAETLRDIEDAESNIETKKINLEEAKLNYDELLLPLTDSERSSANSQLTSASVSLQKARNELDEATLISPIEGEIAQLNYKTGDTILKDDSKSVVSIINNDTLFIEVDIEEADISKLEVGQRAVAAFDALDELELEGEISFISLTSETSNNGIVTYLVRVLFENTGEANVREGMTAYVEFITAGVDDVLVIPVEAVKNVAGSPSVQRESGEWAKVVTGFTDGDDVEIISGLSVGDKIVY